MAAKVPEAVRRLIDLCPLVGFIVILVERVLAAGTEHEFFYHDLRSSNKQMQSALKQKHLDVGAGCLLEGEVSFTAPGVLLDVVHLDSKRALVVPADACYVVDAVFVQGRQALSAGNVHRR